MKAIVKKPFAGKPDESAETRQFAVGDDVTGDLAEVAMREGWAEEVTAKKRRQGPARSGGAGDGGDADTTGA